MHSRQAPRSQVGHWEADTFIGKSHKIQIFTLTERTSRLEIVYKLATKTASEMAQAIIRVLKNLPKKVVKFITPDRGKEFHQWIEVEKSLGNPVLLRGPWCAGSARHEREQQWSHPPHLSKEKQLQPDDTKGDHRLPPIVQPGFPGKF
ncbi:IS30 family transposase [Planococcus antarcticus]|uniref:IS30 family transposase n=1 Tax=Planococcus antarcticus TaxID=161360 RepID=UPI0012DD60B5|nr:IS30 family transposase [Planococcus antarcticus]